MRPSAESRSAGLPAVPGRVARQRGLFTRLDEAEWVLAFTLGASARGAPGNPRVAGQVLKRAPFLPRLRPGVGPAGPRGSRVFPGGPDQLGVLRRWIEDLFPPSLVRDDLIEVACELAGNAICHTRSGDGGKFEVRVECMPGVLSVTVADDGGESEPQLVVDPLAEHGRGLRIVHALSARVTVTGGKQGRLVRADLPWMDCFEPE
jgi:anti-sigma regulatory factor (Ser/Thr protein kinase)